MSNNINPKAQQVLQDLKDQLKYISQISKNPTSVLQTQMKKLRPIIGDLGKVYQIDK